MDSDYTLVVIQFITILFFLFRPSGVLLLVVNMQLILILVVVVKIMTYLASVHIAFAGIALKRLTVQWIVTQCRNGF
jgi:hypothetical protein